MRRIRLTRRRIIYGSVVIFFIFVEWISYLLCSFTWASLPNDAPVRILLVSDPQLIGDHNEPPVPLGTIIRWDADRFLAKTYALAFRHVQPDVVVFLGDLMDEGSIASESQYAHYIKRFYGIFQNTDDTKMVHIPGDNDIGGEGADAVTDIKTQRFKKAFQENNHVEFKFVEFVRLVNCTKYRCEAYQTANYFTGKVEKVAITPLKKRVLLSHFPVVPAARRFGIEAINAVQPDIIFSGHEHESFHCEGNRTSGKPELYEPLEESGRLWSFDTSGASLHEIMVPSCSYRMGKVRMGYGAAALEEDGTLHYTVLWLPGRYPQLFCYLCSLGVILTAMIYPVIVECIIAGIKNKASPCCCFR